jgi:hypothetical protein
VYFTTTIGSAVILAGLAACGLAPLPLLASPLTLVLLWRPLAALAHNRRLPDIDAQTAKVEAILLALAIGAFAACR